MNKLITVALITLSATAFSQTLYLPSGLSSISSSSTANVGIGRSDPQANLHVWSSNASIASFQYSGTTSPANNYPTINAVYDPGGYVALRSNASVTGVNLALGTYHFPNLMMISDGGNVGINTTSPVTTLQIMDAAIGGTPNATIPNQGVLISGNGTGGSLNMGIDATGSTFYSWMQSRSRANATPYNFALNPNGGNIGIGTTSPVTTLQIMDAAIGGAPNATIPNQGVLISGNGTGGSLNMGIDATGSTLYSWIQSRSRANATPYNLALNPNGGNVGIGTPSPDAKLAVKGQVHAQEVKVDLNGAVAPDYVFEKGYKLTSLEEIKNYIDQNKHLPEVPSAKEMEKNGVQLGEMNMLLLKKIEELTLYVIELKNAGDQTKEENSKLKKRVVELEKITKQ